LEPASYITQNSSSKLFILLSATFISTRRFNLLHDLTFITRYAISCTVLLHYGGHDSAFMLYVIIRLFLY